MCIECAPVETSVLCLLTDHPDTFLYTNQGEAPVIDGVNDAEDLGETREAFTLLGEYFTLFLLKNRMSTKTRHAIDITASEMSYKHTNEHFNGQKKCSNRFLRQR